MKCRSFRSRSLSETRMESNEPTSFPISSVCWSLIEPLKSPRAISSLALARRCNLRIQPPSVTNRVKAPKSAAMPVEATVSRLCRRCAAVAAALEIPTTTRPSDTSAFPPDVPGASWSDCDSSVNSSRVDEGSTTCSPIALARRVDAAILKLVPRVQIVNGAGQDFALVGV